MPIIKFQGSWKGSFPWVQEGKQKLTAYCIWCNSTFSYDGMGRSALTSHAKGKKHQTVAANREKSIPINQLLRINIPSPNSGSESQPSSSSSPCVGLYNEQISTSSTSTSSSTSSTLEKFLLKDKVTEAEILWCLNTVMNHESLRNAESSIKLFSHMFHDSSVAKEMKLHKDKIAYSIVYGIAPYFKNLLEESLVGTPFVIGFDESFNKIAQRTQMDLSVRFWDELSSSVKSRYLGSVFLNQSKAQNIFEAFKIGTKGLDWSKLLQVSMDGPNVNWAFLKILQDDMVATLGPDGPHLLNLGSCGLHTVNNAFKTGMQKTGWEIIKFLRGLYNLFKMVPARRGQFTEITGSSTFPLQFCAVRWLENANVAKRAIEMVPHLKTYVEAVKGTGQEPQSNSYKIVVEAIGDKLLVPKLAFFESLARDVEPFLREFQTEKPMIPFLYNDLVSLLRRIMERFVKSEEMLKESFYKVDVFEKEDNLYKNLLKVKEIDLGYGTRLALKKCGSVKEKEILCFRKEVRHCYQFLVHKIQEKSPLAHQLTKAISFLNPTSLAINEEDAFKNMRKAFDIFINSNVITASDAEKADREFKEIVKSPLFRPKAENYSRKDERVDSFWVKEMMQKDAILEVTKKCLTLSHGNASLERGFSVNKEVLAENMSEDFLVSRRIIHDAICSAGGLAEWISQPIPKKMIHAMRNSYARFKEAEEHRRKNMTEKDMRAAESRKRTFEMKALEAKRAKIIEDAQREAEALENEIKNLKNSLV